ncbi:MAG: DUF1592 domain-containing protein [Planctomycetes bacterium]|nr:DUF1592 domain-containing protein [Planctomycetota bacterium]
MLAQDRAPSSFAQLKAEGAARSVYRSTDSPRGAEPRANPDLTTFRGAIEPVLAAVCYRCHGPDKQKSDLRVDVLDPDLLHGADVDAWLDVLAVLNNGEMPPPDAEGVELEDADRRRIVDWLVVESQLASTLRRGAAAHASVRRLARYEYSFALQDLLALPFDFGDELPPDPVPRDGFENSSAVLQLGGVQFRACLDVAHDALALATFPAERPSPWYWSVSMATAADREWRRQDGELEQARKKHAGDPDRLAAALRDLGERHARRPNGVHFADPSTGRVARQTWGYEGAKYAFAPSSEAVEPPPYAAASSTVAVIPPRRHMIVELGDRIPERGTLRVRVRAARASAEGDAPPSLRLLFGWQASNNSSVTFPVTDGDLVVEASVEAPQVYQWDVPISTIHPRNSARSSQKLGGYPSPSEFLAIQNASWSGGDVRVDHVEVIAPVFASWPPASHRSVFPAAAMAMTDERERSRAVLAAFVPRAWRRPVGDEEIARKLRLFERVRAGCDDFEQAMLEVLATVLAAPDFLLVGPLSDGSARLTLPELATRLSLFLWCSAPDDELRALAADGRLAEPAVLDAEVSRLLADPRARRFGQQFVRQWLDLRLLDFLHVDRKRYPQFDGELLVAMRREPVALFDEVLRADLSVLEFVQADFAMVNERLARHYGLRGVVGNGFRRVALDPASPRGGLLTQAGLLAMNSDGIDSHPLKRGVWLLERLLDDPPPPPPAAVPKIDLADPEIAKMTLKQRLEHHRDQPACMSCHARIDPWGIALEHFDAVGSWRDAIEGRPVDASAQLFNAQRLDGADGLQRYLLDQRQDQFVRALVTKLATFALGRPMTFADRAEIDRITGEVRRRGDGLATMVRQIAASELFRSR